MPADRSHLMQADAAAILALLSELYSAAQQAQAKVQELERRLAERDAQADNANSGKPDLTSVRGEV